MKRLSKKFAIYITAIVLAIGLLVPASVFADIDPGTKTIEIDYDDAVRTGSSCLNRGGTYYIGDASFKWSVEWYYKGEYQSPGATLVAGETYTAVATVRWDNEEAEAYDLIEYSVSLKADGEPFPCDKEPNIEASKSRISYTYQITPQAPPNRDLGAFTLDLSKGPVKMTDYPAILLTLEAMDEGGYIEALSEGIGDDGYFHVPFDLDKDGKADIEIIIKDNTSEGSIAAYGNVSGKAPVTIKFTDEDLPLIAQYADGDPYYSSVTFIFSTTSLAKATIKGITAKTYTGKALKPAPKVVLKGKTLKVGKDYTVSYKKNVNVGTATVVIKGKGSYTGTKTKTFKINPKGTSLKSVAKAPKAVKVKWTKQSAKMKTTRISGYQILLATNSKFTKGKKTVNIAGYSKISKKVTGLKGGKKYYVKIRTYKKIGNAKYYSKWSGVKSVKTAK